MRKIIEVVVAAVAALFVKLFERNQRGPYGVVPVLLAVAFVRRALGLGDIT